MSTDLELFLAEQKAKAKKKFIFWMVVGGIITISTIFGMFMAFQLMTSQIVRMF